MIVDNRTPWAVAVLAVTGARGEPALCIAVEATWQVRDGTCRPAAAQPPVELAGRWHGPPAGSSPRDPPTSPMPKAGTDVVLAGHAVAPAESVELRLGPLAQRLRVVGDRTWQRRWCGIRPSPPAAWERIPLLWERAAGGSDGAAVEARNPLGRGFRARGSRFVAGLPLPNLEHPGQPLRRWGQAPEPAGCGWTLPAFAHRQGLDPFSPSAANAAAPGLVAVPGLRGDEEAQALGVRADGPWRFRLPGIPPPRLRVAARDGDLTPAAVLDTVLIDADAGSVRTTWRGWTVVAEPALVAAVEVG